ncbi:NAD-dependent epimerase/dehydratase family protein [Halosquirtibacter xylanolyticus]|uniref:NAD-dependent epimerase/dehydratase family protein n=1 Tax=Halosquirtibacter xylanolyticus TaxID=3374599 RepID=UPI0037492620|nr:NAD-dependent epimerase/dehydratase family protein [Prolixibacteraceae bacterium]
MILVTGGTGMLGSHLLMRLVQNEPMVRATKRKHSSLQVVENLFHFFYPEEAKTLLNKIEWVDADLKDTYQLAKALHNVDTVYHTAAIVSFRRKDEIDMIVNNREGTANLLDLSIEAGVKKFCHVSSVAALEKVEDKKYTDEENYWKTEKAKHAYGISKFQSEMEVWRAKEMGLPIVIVNPSIILGPGTWQSGSSQFFSSVAEEMYFYTEGGTGFVDVLDCVDAMISLVSTHWEAANGKRFVLNSDNLAYKDLFTRIAKEINTQAPKWKISRRGITIAYWFESILSMLMRRQPKITKSTINSATNRSYYSGKLITETIPFTYRSIDEAIKRVAKQFLWEHQNR